jgi:hypothetical protein
MTGAGIRKNGTFTLDDQLGLSDKTTSAELVDTACKNRNQKPMYQVLCDLAKSVYRIHA